MEGGGFLVFGLGERVETASFPIYIYVTLFSCLAHTYICAQHSFTNHASLSHISRLLAWGGFIKF